LLNCEEVQLYIVQFSNGLATQNPGISELEIGKRIEKEYVSCLIFSPSP
jgi:hypothetical protein